MRQSRHPVLALLGLSFAAGSAGCGGGDECTVDTSYDPVIDPAAFVATVDNPFMPLVPGTSYTYAGGGETVEVTVTSERKTILGVECVVVHDVVTLDGEIIEDTFDWYAQDAEGNVWYFGEDTKAFENGQLVDTDGSWEAGVDGAKPGIVMKAQPAVSGPYQQEYYACEAEDRAEIIAVDASVEVPYGSFTACVQTHDYTPLEPEVNEHKFYCSGVGFVLEVDVPTGQRLELVEVTTL